MRKAFLAGLMILTAAAVAACGAYQFPGGSPSPSDGMVSGRVLSIPCSPVETAGNTCAGRPLGGLGIVYTSGGATQSTVTDAQGNYTLTLPPGTWKVTLKTYMRIISGPTSITITPGAKVVANYVLDNGIRAPVPQQ